MLSVWNIIRHKFFKVAATVAMLIMLPVAIFVSQQPQDQRGLAEDATVLSFMPLSSPTLPIVQDVGGDIKLDLMIEPKDNKIKKIEIELNYNINAVKPSVKNPITINSEYFPDIIEGPIYKDGMIKLTLSIGSDLTKSISEKTKIATFNFTTTNPSELSKISFNRNTAVYAITIDNPDGENVLSTTIPAYLKIE